MRYDSSPAPTSDARMDALLNAVADDALRERPLHLDESTLRRCLRRAEPEAFGMAVHEVPVPLHAPSGDDLADLRRRVRERDPQL
jgi:hypothetical protein